MAAANAMRTMFGRLGFSGQGPVMLTVDQGIDNIDELKDLDDDEVETLLKLLRRPGGTVVNPNAANPGQPAHITAPGISVSMRAATHLKLAVYYCRHMGRTSRPLRTVDITCPNIKALKALREEEDASKDPTKEPTIDKKNWSKTLEAIQEWIGMHLGITKVPLSYVVREEIDYPPHPTEPAFGQPESPYSSHQEEMVARAPIRSRSIVPVFMADFQIDNKAVWELICGLCREKDCWTHVKPYAKKKDGRGAFLALWAYYLGKQNVDNQATMSEKGLELASWSGDTKRYSFDDYVKIHMDHHSVLTDLTAHGYAGIDERSKVRHLLKGIKTTKLDSIKATILASDTLRSDFGSCVTLYKDYMTQDKGVKSTDERNISGLNAKQGGGGGNGSGGKRGGGKRKRGRGNDSEDGSCEDRYYTSEEYSKLSKANRSWLRTIRNKRVKKGEGKENPSSKTERAIAVLSTAVDALQVNNVAEVATNPTITTLAVVPPAVTNTNNSALTRIATRQGN